MQFMENTRAKTNPKPLELTIFLLVWIGGYILVYLLMYLIDKLYWTFINIAPENIAIQMVNLQYSWTLPGFVFMGLLYGSVLSLAQRALIRRQYGFRLKQWLQVSLVGWLVGSLFAFYAENVRYPATTVDGFILSLLAFWMPAVILQAIQLRRGTKQWWLWIVANSVAVLAFAGVYLLVEEQTVLVLLQPQGFFPAAIMQSAIAAAVLVYLFGEGNVREQETEDKEGISEK
jgi:hypothetical protein